MLPAWTCGWFWVLRVLFGWYKGEPYLKKLSAFILHGGEAVQGHLGGTWLKVCGTIQHATWRRRWGITCGMHFLPPCGLHFNCFFVSRPKSERQDDRTTTRWSWTETAANTSRCFYRLGRSKPPLPTTDLPCLYGLLGPGNGFGATSCPVNKDSKTLPLAFPSLQCYSRYANSSPGIGISSVWARLLFDRYQIPKGGLDSSMHWRHAHLCQYLVIYIAPLRSSSSWVVQLWACLSVPNRGQKRFHCTF